MDISEIKDKLILEMILIKFGYRFIHRYMFKKSAKVKEQQITALQKIYDLRP
jgi:hypothetical protein